MYKIFNAGFSYGINPIYNTSIIIISIIVYKKLKKQLFKIPYNQPILYNCMTILIVINYSSSKIQNTQNTTGGRGDLVIIECFTRVIVCRVCTILKKK